MLGAGAVGALLQCPSAAGEFGSCLPFIKSTSTPQLRVSAMATTPVAIAPAPPPQKAASAWADALIAGSFDMLPAEPGGPAPVPAAVMAAPEPVIEVTGSATARPPVAALPQAPPPALVVARVAEAQKSSEIVPADPALVEAVERLDARIDEVRAAGRTAATDPAAPVPATKPASFASSDTRIVGGKGVTVRSGPSTSNARLFALSAGQKVTVKGKKRGWLNIVDAQGRSGWAYSSYLSTPKT